MCKWFCVMALLYAQPVFASGPWFLIRADSVGAEIVSVQDYRALGLTDTASTLLMRSGLEIDSLLTKAISELPDQSISQEIQRLISNDDWLVIIDLVGVSEPRMPAYTNVAEEGFSCPRTFFSGEALLNRSQSNCQQMALIGHEWRHARDFIDGRAPAYFAYQLELQSFDQALDLLEFEYRGFLQHLSLLRASGCLEQDPYGRAYLHGGAGELRQLIAQSYDLFTGNKNQRQVIQRACRWPPPGLGQLTAP